uniref:Uncharacterized protein n=1 Tax=Panagrolaimus superbus TaxID=310955 RepID=A0A914YMX3_9BILA
MVNLKQQLELIDYFGPLICALIFTIILALISLTCLNYCCVSPTDDLTKVEEWGYHHHMHMKLGPHRQSVIERQLRPKYGKVDV